MPSVLLFCREFLISAGDPGSYRDLQEMMADRGMNVDHAKLNRGAGGRDG